MKRIHLKEIDKDTKFSNQIIVSALEVLGFLCWYEDENKKRILYINGYWEKDASGNLVKSFSLAKLINILFNENDDSTSVFKAFLYFEKHKSKYALRYNPPFLDNKDLIVANLLANELKYRVDDWIFNDLEFTCKIFEKIESLSKIQKVTSLKSSSLNGGQIEFWKGKNFLDAIEYPNWAKSSKDTIN